MSGIELLNIGLAVGWAGAAVYLNGQRLSWRRRAMRAEYRLELRGEPKP